MGEAQVFDLQLEILSPEGFSKDINILAFLACSRLG